MGKKGTEINETGFFIFRARGRNGSSRVGRTYGDASAIYDTGQIPSHFPFLFSLLEMTFVEPMSVMAEVRN